MKRSYQFADATQPEARMRWVGGGGWGGGTNLTPPHFRSWGSNYVEGERVWLRRVMATKDSAANKTTSWHLGLVCVNHGDGTCE